MEERFLRLARGKRFAAAADIMSALIREERFFEIRSALSELNESELDEILKKLKKSDREAVLRLLLKPENDVPITEETAEEVLNMPSRKPSAYLEASPLYLFKKRAPWLLVLLISATFTSLIITKFESRLNIISPLLIACVPMMMDTGGNSGAQSSVTVIRAMALGEITPKDNLKILSKELRVAFMLGLTIASVCFLKLIYIDRLIFGQPFTPAICFTVSITLLITVVLAKAVGCTLPLLAKALRLDPAVVVSPFITTIIDALSLTLYCIISVKFLS